MLSGLSRTATGRQPTHDARRAEAQHASSDPLPPPFFILSTMRAGSTALTLALDAHPDLAIGRETALGRTAAFLLDPQLPTGSDWYHFAMPHWHRRYGVERDVMCARIAGFYEEILGGQMRRQGKQRWGEKTPLNAHYAPLLAELWPQAQFIHLIRHPLSVCASMTQWTYPIKQSAGYWAATNTQLLDLEGMLGPERYQRIRYEDLVTEPEGTLRALLEYLRVPWSDAVLDHPSATARRYRNEEIEGGPDNRPDRPLDCRSIDRWQERLTRREAADCLRITQTARERLGYGITPRGGPLPPLRWRPGRERPRSTPQAQVRDWLLRLLARRLGWYSWQAAPHPDQAAFDPMMDAAPLSTPRKLPVV